MESLQMSVQKILLDDKEYEWASAEVVSIDYAGRDRSELYTVYCRILNTGISAPTNQLIRAKPLHSNIKHLPIKGEIVLVCLAPTSGHSAASYGRQYYYTSPISIRSSVHHNGLPGANTLQSDPRSQTTKSTDATVGVISKTSDRTSVKDTIDPGFPERIDVYPIQPYSGDIILEGRWGQSIRLGSTVDVRRKYPISPKWGIGLGATGNPITIISNGTNPNRREKSYNEFHIESPDNDDASIWLTSGQSVRFTPATSYMPSLNDKGIDLFRKNLYAGNQIILASDRLILNANRQELVGFAKEGIGFATDKVISLNAGKTVEMESSKISLGIDATSPCVLGDKYADLLQEILDLLNDMNKSLRFLTVPTSWGVSGTPINGGDFISYQVKIRNLMNKIPSTLSSLVYLNRATGGPSESERDRYNESKALGSFLPMSSGVSMSEGDGPMTISADAFSPMKDIDVSTITSNT